MFRLALLRFRGGGPPLITQLLRRHDSGKGVVTAGLPKGCRGQARPASASNIPALRSSTPFRTAGKSTAALCRAATDRLALALLALDLVEGMRGVRLETKDTDAVRAGHGCGQRWPSAGRPLLGAQLCSSARHLLARFGCASYGLSGSGAWPAIEVFWPAINIIKRRNSVCLSVQQAFPYFVFEILDPRLS